MVESRRHHFAIIFLPIDTQYWWDRTSLPSPNAYMTKLSVWVQYCQCSNDIQFYMLSPAEQVKLSTFCPSVWRLWASGWGWRNCRSTLSKWLVSIFGSRWVENTLLRFDTQVFAQEHLPTPQTPRGRVYSNFPLLIIVFLQGLSRPFWWLPLCSGVIPDKPQAQVLLAFKKAIKTWLFSQAFRCPWAESSFDYFYCYVSSLYYILILHLYFMYMLCWNA